MVTVSEMATDARVCREAETLVDAGYEVEIVCLGSELVASVRGVRLVERRYPAMPRRLKLAVMALDFFLAALVRRADIYHAHNVPALPGCWVAARLRRAALVYDAHELYALTDRLPKRGDGRHSRRQQLEAKIEATLGVRADLFLTAGDGYAAAIAHALTIEQPIVIPNFPPLPPRLVDDRLRVLAGADVDDVVILYQGGFYLSSRSLDVVVRSLLFLPQHYRLVLLGFGVTNEAEQLETLANDIGVGDRFTLLPPVPHQQLADFTVGADLGVIPLKLMGDAARLCAPNKLYEYFQAGIPVVTTAAEELAEMVTTLGVGAVYDFASPESLAAAVLGLGPREALSRLGVRARTAAEERYSWEAVRGSLLEAYALMVEPPSSRHAES